MNETHATLDRLETRIDDQAARIEALYRTLELRGILPRAGDAGREDAFSGELFELEESPFAAKDAAPSRRQPTRLRVGDATGV